MSATVKISANLSEEVVEALKQTARKKGVSVQEALRQAISVQKYFQDAVDQGQQVLLEEPGSGRLWRVRMDPTLGPRK